QSTNNVLFRMDRTTVRYVGEGLNELAWIEIAGEDRGEDDPGIDNFAWRDLVLGQDSTNGLWTVNVALRDDYRNFTESGEPEALYVKNLELYSNSILYLEGQKLYTMVGGTWQRVRTGAWPFGDGTGTICNFHKMSGTLILVR
ncbi:MAG: hypothetical protein FWF84_07820, partial [Kiritimatiellaeota bacterium]|nr:hypothetical protein [Kiritimatiellota bacterium]